MRWRGRLEHTSTCSARQSWGRASRSSLRRPLVLRSITDHTNRAVLLFNVVAQCPSCLSYHSNEGKDKQHSALSFLFLFFFFFPCQLPDCVLHVHIDCGMGQQWLDNLSVATFGGKVNDFSYSHLCSSSHQTWILSKNRPNFFNMTTICCINKWPLHDPAVKRSKGESEK